MSISSCHFINTNTARGSEFALGGVVVVFVVAAMVLGSHKF